MKEIRVGLALGSACLAVALVGSTAQGAEPPVVIALVLDTSGSLARDDLARARELATGVLKALPAGSEAAVFAFDNRSRLVQARTTDSESVRTAVEGLQIAGQYTALHDALYDASRYLRDTTATRRAILLVTDGKDENSALNLEDGLKVAQDTLIPVFCVGVGRVEERILRRIGKLTGGDYFSMREATADALAERILAAPVARPAATSSPAPATGPVPSPAGASPAAPLSPTPPTALRSPWLWGSAGVLLLLAAGLVLLAALTRSRQGRSAAGRREDSPQFLDTAQEEALRGTVVSRMDDGGERIERTMLLPERPLITVTRGPRKGEAFPLSMNSATCIGRAGANDVVLDDEAVSGQHCRIRPEGGRFVLHDLQSTNGTLANGRRIERHVLKEGDVIQVGETSLLFRRDQKRGG
jgi:hypothetical protein